MKIVSDLRMAEQETIDKIASVLDDIATKVRQRSVVNVFIDWSRELADYKIDGWIHHAPTGITSISVTASEEANR